MNQKLQISTSELNFELNEDTKKATIFLELTNNNDHQSYLFKIRTSAKIRYVVRPNNGIVQPKTKFRVEISCTALPTDDFSSKIQDKFCVYSLQAPSSIASREDIEEYIKENFNSCQKFNIYSFVKLASTGRLLSNSIQLLTKPNFRLEVDSGIEEKQTIKTDLMDSALSRSFDWKSFAMKETQKIKDHQLKNSNLPSSNNSSEKQITQPIHRNSSFSKPQSESIFEKSTKLLNNGKESQSLLKHQPSASRIFDKTENVKVSFNDEEISLKKFYTWELLGMLLLGTIIGAFLNGFSA